jgi:hypothetical protein
MKCPIYGLDATQDTNSQLRLELFRWIKIYLESFENPDGEWDEEIWWSQERPNHPLDSIFTLGDGGPEVSLEESYVKRKFDFHEEVGEISKWFYEEQTPRNIANALGLCSFEVREAYKYIEGYGSRNSVTSFQRNANLWGLEFELNENLLIYSILFAVDGSISFYKFFDQMDSENGFIFRSLIGTVNGSQIPIRNVAKLMNISIIEASDSFFKIEREYLLHAKDLLNDSLDEGFGFLREDFSYRNEKIFNLLFGD